MYAKIESIDKNTLYQGDIIEDFPFYIFENSQPIKKTEAGYFEFGNENGEDHALIAVETKKQRVMILSQTCDAQRRKNLIISPIYKLDQFIIDNTINKNRAEAIRERRLYYLFYLPEFESLPESLVDLQTMIYVSREKIEQYLPNKIISLSDLGRHHLSWSLATYFGRPAEH